MNNIHICGLLSRLVLEVVGEAASPGNPEMLEAGQTEYWEEVVEEGLTNSEEAYLQNNSNI